jgi:hypothetical protein
MSPVPGSKLCEVRMLRCLLHGALSGFIACLKRSYDGASRGNDRCPAQLSSP